jgi:hypothetical protein
VGGGGTPIVVCRCVATPLVVRQLPASKDVNMEAEKATWLEAVTRQPMKTHQIEKNSCVL